MEKLSLERDYGREQFGNQYFQDVVSKYGVLTYDDKDAAAKAYYAQFNIKPGDSIVPEYEPANDLGYQWRQFVNGFTQSRDKVSDTLDHYGEHPTEIPGAVGGAIYNGVKNTATGTVAYLTSDVPAWTLTQQVHDQYGVPTAYNLGVGVYAASLSGALAAPSLVIGGGIGATPAWMAEWSPVASGGSAGGFPIAYLGSDVPLLLTGSASSGPLSSAVSQGSALAGVVAGAANTSLLDELTANGVKFTREDIVATARNSSGQVVFLEAGNSKAGLQHIIEEHGEQFAQMGVAEAEIPGVIIRAVSEGTLVGYQGSGVGRPIYELTINGQPQRIAVTVGSNGFIVGANPRGNGK